MPRKRKPQPGGIPAGAFRGIGNLVAGGGRYIKATVGRVARHVPICRGELLSTLTPGRSADSKFICGACPPKETPARRRSGWGPEVSAVAVGRGSRYSQLTLSLVSRHCSNLSQRDRALRPLQALPAPLATYATLRPSIATWRPGTCSTWNPGDVGLGVEFHE